MTRLVPTHPAELTPEQREVYEHITGGPRAGGPRLFDLADEQGRLHGPFGPMLLAPRLGDALQGLGAAVRYGTCLDDRTRELAILTVATHWDSAFERYAHEAIGRSVGLSDDELLALRDLDTVTLEDPREAAAVEVVRTLVRDGDLDDEAYAAAAQHLSQAELFELTTLVGYYATLALVMRVFRVGMPEVVGDIDSNVSTV
jgi:4-carboxymuconolactone decarboxylase